MEFNNYIKIHLLSREFPIYLIQIVNAMPKAMVAEVSPRSVKFRNYNKIPLILTQVEAAL